MGFPKKVEDAVFVKCQRHCCICDSCRKPDFKFMNNELEKIKLQLYNDTRKFLSSLSVNTFPNSVGNNTIPPEWEYEQPERFKSVVDELNKCSTAVWQTFCLLVTSARKLLAV